MDPKFIEAVIAPGFLLMGLSHLLQPQLWVRFFEAVRNTGLAAVIVPLFVLPFGLVLIAGHNVWKWDWPVLLTIAGWGMTIKSAAYLLVPGLADRALSKKMATSPRSFQIVGAPIAVIGAILTWHAWMR
jgi:uncharacterized protein YjeT (DUF2065 family)